MNICAIIPARYKSSRFPGKPLQALLGKPMIIHVCDRAAEAVGKEHTYVATDDQRIFDSVIRYGYQAIMTPENCLTGTDRVAVASIALPYEIILNIQGDEPAISAKTIWSVIDQKIANPKSIINAMAPLLDNEDPHSVNLPKVVATEDGRLLYMSRAAVPSTKSGPVRATIRKQVCVYAFNKSDLESYLDYGRKSKTEELEDIEILRFLELGINVQMVSVESSSVAVDAPEDIIHAEEALRNLLS